MTQSLPFSFQATHADPPRGSALIVLTGPRRLVLLLFLITAVESRPWNILAADGDTPRRPNLLWISCEDISPNLGCYGDAFANTPVLDQLASEGVRFTRAFTHAGVCAVLRSGVITGVYPISIGAQHMRSRIIPPPYIKCFPEYLRSAGYYCTNRSKTDYQFDSPLSAWDRQGANHDDWRGRAEGQPFFSVINLTVTHESQIRHSPSEHQQVLAALPDSQHHDPERAGYCLPPYLPDTPATRQNWAWYHDNISYMDQLVGEILQRLEEDGLKENTLVVFWSDHGQGMPRGKRTIYDSGTHVPLIIRWPGVVRVQQVNGELVSLLDLAPTMLCAAGLPIPKHFHGRALLGLGPAPQGEPPFLFFHRDRMDEAYDLIRGARDRQYRYVRNYEPEKPYAQGIEYMDQMPAMQDWRRLNAEGALSEPQRAWFEPRKPIEELYDTDEDPYELHNLAAVPGQQPRLAAMRQAVERWQEEVGDLGLVPEPVLIHAMRPPGVNYRTARPRVQLIETQQGPRLQLTCATPGSSIVFRWTPSQPWQLYSQSLQASRAETLEVVACRLGFRNSPRERWSHALAPSPGDRPPAPKGVLQLRFLTH